MLGSGRQEWGTHPLHFPYLYLLLRIVALLVLVRHTGGAATAGPRSWDCTGSISTEGVASCPRLGLQRRWQERSPDNSLCALKWTHLLPWRRL